jgi:hypothetical protein
MSLCISHSVAQASHIWAHMAHMGLLNSLFFDMNFDVIMHMSAQSMAIMAHLFIFVSRMDMHSVAHISHISAHSLHMSIHFWFISCFNICI